MTGFAMFIKSANQNHYASSLIKFDLSDSGQKSSDGKRIIKGVASTPTPDRVNDIMLPDGAKFKLPMPLLMQHDRDRPIGHVVKAVVKKTGIEIEAHIESGIDYIDLAWQQITKGLVQGLSIGFGIISYEQFADNGKTGWKIKEWEWRELSAVTIPCNAECTIESVKSLTLAALGNKKPANNGTGVYKIASFGSKSQPISESKENMTYAEQIKQTQDRIELLNSEVNAIMSKSVEESRTLSAEEGEKFDGHQDEIKELTTHLERLKKALDVQQKSAKPVTNQSAHRPVGGASYGSFSVKSNDQDVPGIEFARYVKCLAFSQGNVMQAAEVAKSWYPDSARIHNVLKAAVSAGSISSPAAGGNLLDYTVFTGDFIEFLQPETILGKFGKNGVPALRAIPFNVTIKGQSSAGEGYWAGEAQPRGVTNVEFLTVNLDWKRVGNIAVLSQELLKFPTIKADVLVRNALVDALQRRMDLDFINPASTATASRPASIANGVIPIAATGTTADHVRSDVKLAIKKFIDANMPTNSLVFIMQSSQALSLSLATNALGQAEFPTIGMNGGSLLGIPVITSQYVPSGTIALVSAGDVYLADDGFVSIEVSREATIEMDDSPVGVAAHSLFQHGEIGIKAERYINWGKRRTDAVAVISGANYGV